MLHVEDDVELTELVAQVVSQSAEVEAVYSLAGARAWLMTRRPDLVVLDVALPDGSGLELLDELLRFRPRPKVIVYSGQEVDIDGARQVDAVLTKSRVSFGDLNDTVGRLLQDHAEEKAT